MLGRVLVADDGSYRLARWIVRIASGILLIAATLVVYATAPGPTSARQSPAHQTYWYTILVVFAGWTLLRVTVYRHPRPEEYGHREKLPRKRAIAFACLMSSIIVALDSLPFFITYLVVGVASGTIAAGVMYPALFLVQRRWRKGAAPSAPKKAISKGQESPT